MSIRLVQRPDGSLTIHRTTKTPKGIHGRSFSLDADDADELRTMLRVSGFDGDEGRLSVCMALCFREGRGHVAHCPSANPGGKA